MALAQILLRGGTSAEWLAANPILAAREMAVDTTEHRVKVGDGVSAWTSLPWTSMAASEVTRLEAAATALAGAASPTDAVNETLIKDPASKTARALAGTFAPLVTAAVLNRDSAGLITSVVENGVTVIYARDAQGRIQSETKNGKTTTYTRDAQGRVSGWETV